MKTRHLLLILALMLVAIFVWLARPLPQVTTQPNLARETKRSVTFAPRERHTPAPPISVPANDLPADIGVKREVPAIKATPMRLAKKILAQNKWNDGPDAFAREIGHEASTLGPSSIAYVNGTAYVMDTLNSRILGYNKDGSLISSVTLPTKYGDDLLVDSSDWSLLVVDHFNNKIYKVIGNEVAEFQTVDLKDKFPFGTKFRYDPAAGEFVPENPNRFAEVVDGKLVFTRSGQSPLTVAFDEPVFSVDEAVTDGSGNVWLMFYLEGDFEGDGKATHRSRLARINPAQGIVETAEILNTWSAFDATRHMAATQNGVVFLSGDGKQGLLQSCDYMGASPRADL
jgi:hypothetical protein